MSAGGNTLTQEICKHVPFSGLKLEPQHIGYHVPESVNVAGP
jgi:hypothetical protein